MNEIKDLLRRTIGLHAPTIGSPLIDHAITARMQLHNLAEPGEYLRLLRESAQEVGELVESVVVKETWFFRDREPFRALASLVQKEWLPTHPIEQLRILSAPCSTGEEPYSLAMVLLDAGMEPARFQIEALDISPAAIARARRAEYGKNSFRGKDLAFRSRYFTSGPDGYTLNEAVRRQVHWRAANLLDEPAPANPPRFDFIFCRNLLIYFDRATQDRCLQKLAGMLSPGGALFVGSAEVAIATRNGFVSANLPFSFACHQAVNSARDSLQPERPAKIARAKKTDITLENTVESLTTLHPGFLPTAANLLEEPTDLSEARKLAEQGNLEDAGRICEAYLRQRGVSAEAYYLLGLVRSAAGADSQADDFYRKALYLEPDHYQTLIQWASLSARNGNGKHARLLTERAERLRKGNCETS